LLHELVWPGLAWRYGGLDGSGGQEAKLSYRRGRYWASIVERADYELGIIDTWALMATSSSFGTLLTG